jgi:hypothetical protein
MYHKMTSFGLLLGVFLCARVIAQDKNAATQPPPPKPMIAYKLDFSLNELEDGKKVNTRHYSMNLMGQRKELKIGTRVPIQSEGKIEYLDIGTYITAHLERPEPPVVLDVDAEISSLPTPSEAATNTAAPLIRWARIGATTVVIPDKPTVIGTVDDPGSRRQFQLEVIATKLQ